MDTHPFLRLLAAALLAACGAMIPACVGDVVDNGTSSSTDGSDDASACTGLSTVPLCGGQLCPAGSEITNGCQTSATCNGKPVVVSCTTAPAYDGGPPSEEGGGCICAFDGTRIPCDESTNATLCNPTAGCCALWFVGG